jgi:hypothetical protein
MKIVLRDGLDTLFYTVPILQWPGATSPKLPPEPPHNEQTGGKTGENHCAA